MTDEVTLWNAMYVFWEEFADGNNCFTDLGHFEGLHNTKRKKVHPVSHHEGFKYSY